jgi:hypothetical protein
MKKLLICLMLLAPLVCGAQYPFSNSPHIYYIVVGSDTIQLATTYALNTKATATLVTAQDSINKRVFIGANTVYIYPSDNVATVWATAAAGDRIVFTTGTYTMTDLALDPPNHCTIELQAGAYLNASGNDGDSLFYEDDGDTITFRGPGMITAAGGGSWLVVKGGSKVSFENNICLKVGTWLIGDGGMQETTDTHIVCTRPVNIAAYVPTNGFIVYGQSKFNPGEGTTLNQAYRDLTVPTDSYGMEFYTGGGCYGQGINFTTTGSGGNTITADSAGTLSLHSDNIVQTAGSYALFMKNGAPSNPVYRCLAQICYSDAFGGLWTQDSAYVVIHRSAFVKNVRLGGHKNSYWIQSDLEPMPGITLTIATTADTVWMDQLNNIKAMGGVFIDSTKTGNPISITEPGVSRAIINQADYLCQFPGTGPLDTVLVPGLATTGIVSLSSYAGIYTPDAVPDSLFTPIIKTLAAGMVIVQRDQTSAKNNGSYMLHVHSLR